MKKRNKIAIDLFTKKYRKRVVRPKKGKGSFKRKKTQFKLSLKKSNHKLSLAPID